MLPIDQLVNHRSNEDSQWPPTLGPLCAVTPRSALTSWGLSPAQKDSIMYDAHTVVLPLAPIWIATWQAYPQMGQGWGEGVRCRGEAAHAEVTNWNNDADERLSCLGFRKEDYWTDRSPFCIRLESTAMGRREGSGELRRGAQSSRSLHTAHTKAASCTSEQPTVQKCDQHNAEQILVCLLVCVCACVRMYRCVLFCVVDEQCPKDTGWSVDILSEVDVDPLTRSR